MNATLCARTGLILPHPVMTASGTWGYGTEFASRMSFEGLGGVVCKGTTRHARPGNPPIRLTETAAGMLNAVGLQNIGVEAVIRDKAPVWATWDVPVFVNVSGGTVEEYAEITQMLDGVPGVAGVELNISCPNVKEGGVQFGVTPGSAAAVTAGARAVTSLPVIVKLSPNVSDIRGIAAAVETAGADALTVANTVYGMAVDVRKRTPVLSNVTGGLSGPAIKPLALYLVHAVSQAVRIPVIGAGGIMAAEDALEFLLAGATAVQMGTALLLDPAAWRAVSLGIEEWLVREGIRTLDEIVGAANAGFKGRAGEASLAGSQ